MERFLLTLSKPDGKLCQLTIRPDLTSLGMKWSEALKKEIDLGHGIAPTDNDRVYNFSGVWNEQVILEELKTICNSINQYRPDTIKFHTDMNQLHHYFEVLRGDSRTDNSGTEFWKEAPRHIKDMLYRMNVLIHRYEDLGSPPRIVVHMKDRERYPLEESDYQYCIMDHKPLDVVLNYCHLGKTVLDVYKDQDTIINPERIEQQWMYSSDFKIFWGHGPAHKPDKLMKYYFWTNQNKDKLPQSWKKADGFFKVGEVQGDPKALQKYLEGVTKIERIDYV